MGSMPAAAGMPELGFDAAVDVVAAAAGDDAVSVCATCWGCA